MYLVQAGGPPFGEDGIMNGVSSQPGAEQLAAFAHGRLREAERAALERHVADCDSCCQALRRVPDDTLVANLRGNTSTSDVVPAEGNKPSSPAIANLPEELR